MLGMIDRNRIGCLGLGGLLTLGMCAGCETHGAAEPFGKTYYLDGAGNWGYGASEVPAGLRQAGYRGDVEVFLWTMSLNPLVDQLVTANARLRAAVLADKINRYAQRYPGRKINVIALSAGTGVAIWAIENLDGEARVNNVMLLGSSLSSDYDARPALRNIDGRIYVYYSSQDSVLEAVRTIGTIDGKRGVDSVGAVGLHPPGGANPKIVNIPWSRKWLPLGWVGYHTDCTNEKFVRYELAKHLVEPADAEAVEAVADRSRARTRIARTDRP
jgi:hypothetical protein